MTDFTAPLNAEVKFKFIYKFILHPHLFGELWEKINKKSTDEPMKYGNNSFVSDTIFFVNKAASPLGRLSTHLIMSGTFATVYHSSIINKNSFLYIVVHGIGVGLYF